MRRAPLIVFALVALCFANARLTRPAAAEEKAAAGAGAESHVGAADAPHHRVYLPDQVQWKDGPPSLPSGVKVAILEGDPSKEGFFAMRLQLPDGCRIAPHTHPNVERVTVISGTLQLGKGDKFEEAAAQPLPAGSYSTMHPGMSHFAWAQGETVLQLATVGPWSINYLNPQDDPRTKP